MGPKAKAKAKEEDLSALTDEEREEYLAEKARKKKEKEDAARLKKEQEKIKELKFRVEQEKKRGEKNQEVITRGWKQIFRQTKRESLMQDLEVLWHTFEHVTDYKNDVIENLVQELSEAEDQHERVHQSHVEAIDRLLDVFRERLEDLGSDCKLELQRMGAEASGDQSTIEDLRRGDEDHLAVTMFVTDQRLTDTEVNIKGEFFSKKDEVSNRAVEDRQTLRFRLVAKSEELWSMYLHVLKEYHESTEDRRKQFAELKKKDKIVSAQILQQLKTIKDLHEKIRAIQRSLLHEDLSSQHKLLHLRGERNQCLQTYQVVKLRLQQDRAAEHAVLLHLTVNTTATLKELKRIRDKGEGILRRMALCSRFQTQKEKVVPFYESSLPQEDMEDTEQQPKKSFSVNLSKPTESFQYLEGFWQRYNRALLDHAALKLHHEALLLQNKNLMTSLKRYLSSIPLTQDDINYQPALLSLDRGNLRPSSQMPLMPPNKAAHAVQNILI